MNVACITDTAGDVVFSVHLS